MNPATKFKNFLDKKGIREAYLKNVNEQCTPETPVTFLLQLFRGYPEDCYIAGAFVTPATYGSHQYWKNIEDEWDGYLLNPQNTKL